MLFCKNNKDAMKHSDLTPEERERIVAETIWLNYFNKQLFQHGTITEKEYRRMFEKIIVREGQALRRKA